MDILFNFNYIYLNSYTCKFNDAIQRHLLEAYCVERDIPVIRIKSSKGELVSFITEGEGCEEAILMEIQKRK